MKPTLVLATLLLALVCAGPSLADCTTQRVHRVTDDGKRIPMHDTRCDTSQQEIEDHRAVQSELCALVEEEDQCKALLAKSATAARDHRARIELAKGRSGEDTSALAEASAEESKAMRPRRRNATTRASDESKKRQRR